MEVRAQLETEAAVRRSQGTIDPVLYYDGTVLEATTERLTLDVLVARSSSAFREVEIRDTVRLETAEVRSMMRRSISPGRTALFIAALGAGAVAAVMGIDAVVGGTDGDDGRPPNPSAVVPLFGWTGSRAVPSILIGVRRE